MRSSSEFSIQTGCAAAHQGNLLEHYTRIQKVQLLREMLLCAGQQTFNYSRHLTPPVMSDEVDICLCFVNNIKACFADVRYLIAARLASLE